MEILNKYFGTLIFQYVENKKSYAIYVASIKSMIGGDNQRYVIVFVPESSNSSRQIGAKTKIQYLEWTNLQTRTCPNTYKVTSQQWTSPSSGIPDIIFSINNRVEGFSTYNFSPNKSEISHFPFELIMIHSAKKKSIYQYPNDININWAIDQFTAIFNLKVVQQLKQEPEFEYRSLNDLQQTENTIRKIPHPLQNWSNALNENINNNDIEFL